ncbi:MAG: hypothetical protein E6Q44_12940 [Flavobacteriales bacterium]|nr:MAG: hypothetical protein E6Q44_12940 [Flavobacteriales bacterium]
MNLRHTAHLHFLTPLLLFTCLTASAQDTITVHALDRALVVTDPAHGVRYLHQRVALPPASTPVRRILLNLTYACPDSLNCAEWDYLDHVLVRPLHSTDTVELARMLTPYGSYYKQGWQFTWASEVSELWPVLHDSVELIHVHHGYEPNNDRGWAVSLDLHYITGKPIAPILGIEELYRGHYAYGDSTHPIEEALAPRRVRTLPGAEWLRIRTQQTGHGMNPSDGCGEFCAKWRHITVDGREVQRRMLWKECASNPLHPQAGTWIFDRADWCPGEMQPPDRITVPMAPGRSEHMLDVDMEPYTVDSSSAFTNLSAYAVQLGRANAAHDAMITEVLVPSAEPRHARMNEGHDGPRIVVANAGGDTLRTLTIRYGRVDGTLRTHLWQGLLPFGASDSVDLPGPMDHGAGGAVFTAILEKPNGKRDAWPADNRLRSAYPSVEVLPDTVILQLRTNAQPAHNALRLTEASGKVLVDRPLGSLRADTLYSDTLHLPSATYRLQLQDTAGDGLEFWYNTEGGSGHLRLLDRAGRLLKYYKSDHGNGLVHVFRTGTRPTVLPDTVPMISLFPRRTQGRTRLDYFANDASMLHLTVSSEDSTAIMEIKPPQAVKEASFPIDLGWAPPGRYLVTLLRDGRSVFRQRIRLER